MVRTLTLILPLLCHCKSSLTKAALLKMLHKRCRQVQTAIVQFLSPKRLSIVLLPAKFAQSYSQIGL